jgi:quercetin dioxygenase-like cupin family protein
MYAFSHASGEGEAVWSLNSRMTVKRTGESAGGAFGLVESLVSAGWSPPLHVHHREDGSFWILQGELTFRSRQETFRGEAGSFAFLPRELAHTFVVEGDEPARLLTLITPGGGEGFEIVGTPPQPRAVAWIGGWTHGSRR